MHIVKGKVRTSFLVLALLAVTGWAIAPFGARAETAGSYAYPGLPGPDESNSGEGGLKNVVPPSVDEGSESADAPAAKSEGSSKKGYGPGAHPRASQEGSGSKKYSHGKGHGYGEGHSGGYSPHHGKKHRAEGSGKGYGNGYSGGHSPHHAKKHHADGSGKGHGKGDKCHSKGSGHHYKDKKACRHGGSKGHHGYSSHDEGHFGQGHKHNPFRHILKFREKLGLTQDQVKDIMRMRFDWEKQRIKLGADLMIAHMELDRLVHSGTLDEPKMFEIAKVIGGLKMQQAQIMVEAKIALLKTLTDEQRKKIAHIHGDH